MKQRKKTATGTNPALISCQGGSLTNIYYLYYSIIYIHVCVYMYMYVYMYVYISNVCMYIYIIHTHIYI